MRAAATRGRANLYRGCLMPSCNEPRHYARGLCATHYYLARGLVRRQQITWGELEATGRCYPSHGLGGRPENTSEAIDWLLSAQDCAPK